jgi:trk system potassium uptake protein
VDQTSLNGKKNNHHNLGIDLAVIHNRYLIDRYRVMVGYAGTIFIGIAFLLLLPLLAALLFAEWNVIYSFPDSGFFTLATGALLRYKFKVDSDITLTIQEGGIIVLFAWIGAIIFSALPFLIFKQLNFTQAIFEATSGWTTTGLSVVDVTQTPKTFLLWRSIMQFIGGAGFTVMMLSAIIGPLGLGLFNAEGRSDKLLPNVTQSAKTIMLILSSYTLAGTILYMLAGMPWFDALNHALCALSTGGFSTQFNSIGEFNRLSIELVTIILMLLGATSFAAHYLLLNRDIKGFLRTAELKVIMGYTLVYYSDHYFSIAQSFISRHNVSAACGSFSGRFQPDDNRIFNCRSQNLGGLPAINTHRPDDIWWNGWLNCWWY